MALHSRLHVLNTIVETGLLPLFYNGDIEISKKVIDACLAGGVRVVEFTNRGDFAINVFTELRQHYRKANPELVMGVGSVVDAPTAALYIANGADFIVAPILSADTARLCNRRKVAYVPGCGSLTEISNAEELGVEIVKIFPGSGVGGPGFVKDIKGPCPWTRILPTGGVDATEENIKSWFSAGVTAVGMGSKLITSDDVKSGNYAAITERCKQVLGWVVKYKTDKV